ncbi:hypothetical protein RJ640_008744 [Escallonia rubra]|uniref:Uncharacterized protein n=1 Tax=Escallonia rubra TaxID=112253 RepID=A0AA88TZ21_9ASTE|nr:hypothetical protein RJ640_008744 [Escallonia rubra]
MVSTTLSPMLYLDDWDLIDRDHSSSLSIAIGALKASTPSLPIVGGARAKDIPSSVSKGTPDFCNVYVISKGKMSSTRAVSRPPLNVSPLRNLILSGQQQT